MVILPRTPFIIAEIGINASGDIKTAKKLIDMAKSCGCDAVKFQKRTIETVYTPEFLASPRESPWGNTQGDQKRGLEFGEKEYGVLDRYCHRARNIPWFASAWDIDSLNFLDKYDPQYQKVASAMLTHREFLEEVAKRQKLTFISTGMSMIQDIDFAVKVFRSHDCPFILMHAVGCYPCPDDFCNLAMIPELAIKYECDMGYSSHTISWQDAFLAVNLGAVAIEKHITLDRAAYGSDQAASLEKPGLERLVRECRKNYLGDKVKQLYPEEEESARKLRYWE